MNPFLLVFALAILVAFSLSMSRRTQTRRCILPPGPAPWPIIGNVLDLTAVRPWEKFRHWCNIFNSDIVFLHLPTQPTVILGSFRAAVDLLEKRSHLYSDRKVPLMIELIKGDFNLGIMPYGPRWRAHRRLFHSHFNHSEVDQYRPIQLRNIREFVVAVLASPKHSRKLTRQMVTSIIFEVTYGRRIASMDDKHVTMAQEAVLGQSRVAMPGAFWIEFCPFLKRIPSWFPGATFQKVVEYYRPINLAMKFQPYQQAKLANTGGSATVCVTNTLIEEIRTNFEDPSEIALQEEVAMNVTATAYAAGADTTTSACDAFLLAMALFPDVQTKAQAELDCVVGSSRLPEYEDLERMPYLRAIMMETLRWMPGLALGVPHALTADDVYNGYYLPKGTLVIANQWAMLRDPNDYPDPEAFKPERYLGKDGNIDTSVRDPGSIAFGFGRRACAGRHFSDNTLSIFIATVLHVFKISAGVDEQGSPVGLSAEIAGFMLTMPRHVPCGFKARSAAALSLFDSCLA